MDASPSLAVSPLAHAGPGAMRAQDLPTVLENAHPSAGTRRERSEGTWVAQILAVRKRQYGGERRREYGSMVCNIDNPTRSRGVLGDITMPMIVKISVYVA